MAQKVIKMSEWLITHEQVQTVLERVKKELDLAFSPEFFYPDHLYKSRFHKKEIYFVELPLESIPPEKIARFIELFETELSVKVEAFRAFQQDDPVIGFEISNKVNNNA